eukprot:TRINITY_DN589_c0_g1_i1.p1 TRINITY_DN589_c0_g1~~TRINITY_DN589_c0_g1_i1.p1  ORF type:complete len:426 (+),score=101.94 TRINITY_DN589_c0_g1_i1:5-1282(+)
MEKSISIFPRVPSIKMSAPQVFLDDSTESHIIKLVLCFTGISSGLSIDNGADGTIRVRGPVEETGQFDLVATKLVEASPVKDTLLANQKGVDTWLSYAQKDFLPTVRSGVVSKVRPLIAKLNKTLESLVFLVDNRLSLADIILFGALSEVVPRWTPEETHSFENISRYYDHIQHLPNVHPYIRKGSHFVSFVLDANSKPDPKKPEEKPTEQPAPQKDAGDGGNKAGEEGKGKGKPKGKPAEPAEGKKKQQPVPAAEKPIVFSRLDMRVGKIIQIEKHPDADSLYKEQIDLGNGEVRTVVSGLVKFIPIEQLENRLVLVLCNLKPSTMRKVKSEAMVICASNDDHTQVEIVDPPAGSQPGDRITVEGEEGEPDAPINLSDKKNAFTTALQPLLKTNADGVACFKDKPLLAPKGNLKSSTLKNAHLG